MKQDVAEFVGEGFDGLGGFYVVAYSDDSVVEVGVPVGSVAVASLDREPVTLNEGCESLPQFGGRRASQLDWVDVGQRLTVGL